MKKAMSFLLALVMALSLLPGAVWAEGSTGGDNDIESNALMVGDHKVYYATSVEENGIVNCHGVEVNNKATLGPDGQKHGAFRVTGAAANSKYYVVVMWGEDETASTIKLNKGETKVDVWKTYDNKTVFELTVPEVGTQGDTVVDFNLWVNGSTNCEFGVVFAKQDGGTGGEDNPNETLSEAAQDYMAKYATTGGYLRCGEGTVALNRDNYTEGETNAITTAIHAYRQLRQSNEEACWEVGDQNFSYTELDRRIPFGEYLARLASKVGISLWEDVPSGDDVGAKLTVKGGRVIQLGTGMAYGILSYDERLNVKSNEPEDGPPYFTVPNGMNGFVLVVDAAEGKAVSSLTVPEVVGTKDNDEEVVTYQTNYGTVRIRPMGTITSTKYVYEVRVSDKQGNSGTLNLAANFADESSSPFNVVFENRGGNQPSQPWTPVQGIKPQNASGYLKELYDAEYTFPEFGKDFHLWFPKSLKQKTNESEDWDYDYRVDANTGIVTVYVNPNSSDRWRDAIEEMKNDFLSDGVYFGYYFGNNDNNGNPTNFGFGQHSEADQVDLYDVLYVNDGNGRELKSDYHSNNAEKMVALNKGALSSSIVARQGTTRTAVVVALDNDDGKTTRDAAARYALQIDLVVNKDLTHKWDMENGTLLPTERMTFEATTSDDWTAIMPEAGTVFAYQQSGNYAENAGVGTLTVTAPGEGYSLAWSDSNRGSGTEAAAASGRTTAGIPLKNCNAQKITLRWTKDDSTVVENVTVEYCSSQPWMALLGDDSIKSIPQPMGQVIPEDVNKKLDAAGISVTYEQGIGYFSTSVDAAKLTADDLKLLNEGYRLDKPDEFKEATHYKLQYLGGSENPATHGTEWASESKNSWKNQDMEPIGAAKMPGIPYLDYETLEANGLTVFYTDYQLYRGFVVQWLKAEGPDSTVLGYSYVYGRNGVFETSIDTDIVKTVDDAVTKPTLEGNSEDLQFTCDKNPQSGSKDGRKLFLQFDVRGDYGNDATVYLPYSMFGDLTWEKAQNMPAPTITHYLDSECTISEKFRGEYTPYGVKFTTKSFSPFVIDCSAQSEDNGSGNRYYYTGSGSTGTENTVTSGADQTKQAGDIVKVTVKSGSAKVQTVYVDGAALKAGDYIISGGTIKLQGTYTAKLAQGSHTLKIVYDNGSTAAATFTLKGTTSPKTGDVGVVLYAALGVSSALGTGLVLKKKRK